MNSLFIARQTVHPTVRFIQNNEEKEVTVQEALTLFCVEDIIRIPDSEYPESFSIGDVVTHFNLPILGTTLLRKSHRVVLPRIIKTGYLSREGEEISPLLSFENVLVGEVVEMCRHVAYEDLQDDVFEKTVGDIKNVAELKDRICERYQKSLPDETCETILSQGVGVRKIKLIGLL